MTKYQIFTTEGFDEDFDSLNEDIQRKIRKEVNQLVENPYVGKPLGYKFFREKKIDNYRFYYLIYDEYVVVFLTAISGKKDQQKTIDKIKELMPKYKESVEKTFKNK